MSKTFAVAILSTLLLAAALFSAPALNAEDPDNLHFSTFSLCAIDPATGEVGVAVTTRVPFVGRAVPWVEAGVGGVATQSWTVVEYGRQGLDLLKQGVAPEEVLKKLLADDNGRERRQVGVIDMQGRAAAFTGNECGAWAGHKQGKNYTVQANIMVGPQVIEAVSAMFEKTEGTGMPLAERMILSIEAGYKTGGDKRWGLFQSAAIKVADPNSPGRGGDHISLAIEVGENPDPVAEMKRIYYTTANRLGWREFSEVRGADVIELKRMLHKLGFWRKDLAEFPAPPKFDVDPSLQRGNPDEYNRLADEFRKARGAYFAEYALFDAACVEAVDAFRKANEMDYEGDARGLVDARFINALREQYYFGGK